MTDNAPQGSGYGQQAPWDGGSDFNVQAFVIQQMLGRISTMKVVKIVAVHPGEGLAPGKVDVLPLVNQIDGQGNSTPHGTVYDIPYVRTQTGATAIIADPIVGEIGMMVCADRDISAVKNSRAAANPGSWRRFDMADGIYIGGILGAAPTNYVRLTDSQIVMTWGASSLVVDAMGIHLNGAVFVNGIVTGPGGGPVDLGSAALTTTGPITSGSLTSTGAVVGQGIDLATHHHSGVTVGAGNTGPPF